MKQIFLSALLFINFVKADIIVKLQPRNKDESKEFLKFISKDLNHVLLIANYCEVVDEQANEPVFDTSFEYENINNKDALNNLNKLEFKFPFKKNNKQFTGLYVSFLDRFANVNFEFDVDHNENDIVYIFRLPIKIGNALMCADHEKYVTSNKAVAHKGLCLLNFIQPKKLQLQTSSQNLISAANILAGLKSIERLTNMKSDKDLDKDQKSQKN